MEEKYFSKYLQRGEDLGKRMSHAFERAFHQNYSKAVIISSDCADLNEDIINEAFQALESNDVVIGPAEDGGYYLLGMSHFIQTLFEDKSRSH